jgi:hypothetical protein
MSDNINAAYVDAAIMYRTRPILLHVSCIGAFWSGITWQAVASA